MNPCQTQITNFRGLHLDQNLDLFQEAPEEIGTVLAADSTLRVGSRPSSFLSMFAAWGVIAAACLLLILVADSSFFPIWFRALAGIAAITVGCGGPTLFRSFELCAYVGTEGVAVATCRGSRRNSETRVFRYGSSPNLRISLQNRTYTLKWNGPDAGSFSRAIVDENHPNVKILEMAQYVEDLLRPRSLPPRHHTR